MNTVKNFITIYLRFVIKLDRCVGSESTILTKDITYKSKYKFDGRKWNSNQKWNNDNVNVSVKNITYMNKIIFGILLHVVAKMEYI